VTESEGGDVRHADLVSEKSHAGPASNPLAHSANVTIIIPETVEVRLVDASVLSEYEAWSLITSVLGSAVVGFGVAFLQASAADAARYMGNLVVFSVLLVVSGVTLVIKRRKLHSKTKKLSFRIGEPVEPD